MEQVAAERAPSRGGWVGLLLLYVALPVAVARVGPRVGFPVLFVVCAACLLALFRDSSFDRRELWRLPAPAVLWRITVRALLLSALLAGAALLFPGQAFGMVRNHPYLWLLLVTLYPLLSVPPQELVFRTFFLHRYGALFVSDRERRLASALAFGLAHLLLWNWLAVALSAIGGWIFAGTYLRTRSFPAVCWEHALYGVALFTIGLGRYFVTGWIHTP